MRKIAITLLLASCSMPALAAYKCESGGKTTYSDTPCQQGKTTQLANHAAPVNKADAERETRQNAERKKTVAAMEKTRHQREAAEEKEQQRIAARKAKLHRKCADLALKKKWAEEDASHAAGKAAEKERKKARRITEKYVLTCS
jgi:hypothetical protein